MMKPLGPRVLVKLIDGKQLKSETIFIPETVEDHDPALFAKVLAVGDGQKLEEGYDKTEVRVGDTIIIKRYSSLPITVDGEEAHIVMYDDVLAFLEEEEC